MVEVSTTSICVVESLIILVMEGNIVLRMMPTESIIPEVNIVKARLSPRKSCFLKKSHFNIL